MSGWEGGRFASDVYQPAPANAVAAAVRIPIVAVVSATEGTDDRLIARFGPAAGSGWMVTRITVQHEGPGTPRAYVYVGEPTTTNLVSGTRSGSFDENDMNQGMYVPNNQSLCVAWETLQGVAHARIEYQEV